MLHKALPAADGANWYPLYNSPCLHRTGQKRCSLKKGGRPFESTPPPPEPSIPFPDPSKFSNPAFCNLQHLEKLLALKAPFALGILVIL